MRDQPQFPPLLRGMHVPPGTDAGTHAARLAGAGEAGAGDLFWSTSEDRLNFAIVLEPDVDLARAAQMHHALLLAFADAFGAIAPPEIGVHYRWPGDILVNGACAGHVRTIAPAGADPSGVPDWLVVALDVAITLDLSDPEPGRFPDRTTLHEEGAGDITRTMLLESVSRHFLSWVDTWSNEGFRPLHEVWTGRAYGAGEDKDVTVSHNGRTITGRFVGLDETGSMLFKVAGATRLLPLGDLVTEPPS